MCGLLTVIAIVVAALCGPYKAQLQTTDAGQSADTAAISAVREVLAQQGASIGRNDAALDLSRDKNHLQDARTLEINRDNAAMRQAFADRHIAVVR